MSADDFLGKGRNNTPEGQEEEAKVVEIGVLKPNWIAVQVFRMCEQTIVGGMGTSWHGISAREIRAALILKRVPRAEWDGTSESVRYMGSVVADAINEKVKADLKAKQRKMK